ncbi:MULTISPECIES: hypothetical protein [Sphingomonas]|jgi:hypothetical protein|uniref:Uncharacterized protein n=1 Tax=Sphingomonas abaci TaxID=237611 RepID=A0A7W7ALC4_9SPHN|nr:MULTISPECIES: hypothetical protein [Sphingomonas]PZP27612.1 MAG: hypothetical protein DI613_13765 [Kocuria rhizophila]ATI56847.1 hypothetical protein CP552_14525 [Sphingomonas melonis]MBB4619192.1 hypothetical protein [Sphingomonas abaci]MBX8846486.1 hypothetical protein [Sphingomonas melonis]MBX8855564.1 hypothetical protein [Sphingomonas melonis]
MHWTDTIKRHDYDLALVDVMNDVELAPERRVLAGAAVGVEIDLAWLSAGELLEAFEALQGDVARGVKRGEGYAALDAIITDANPFQMRLWYLLSDTSIEAAVEMLGWLKGLLYARGRASVTLREAGVPQIHWAHEDALEEPNAADIMGCTDRTARDHRVNSVWL